MKRATAAEVGQRRACVYRSGDESWKAKANPAGRASERSATPAASFGCFVGPGGRVVDRCVLAHLGAWAQGGRKGKEGSLARPRVVRRRSFANVDVSGRVGPIVRSVHMSVAASVWGDG